MTSKSNTDAEPREYNRKSARHSDFDKNPCLHEQNISYKCLSNNSYDKVKCNAYFQNYRNCKELWRQVQNDRRHKGIVPNLPIPEERERIKAEYMASVT